MTSAHAIAAEIVATIDCPITQVDAITTVIARYLPVWLVKGVKPNDPGFYHVRRSTPYSTLGGKRIYQRHCAFRYWDTKYQCWRAFNEHGELMMDDNFVEWLYVPGVSNTQPF